MKASNIPYLYCRNGIYYYRNQSTWKSLKTRCKKEAFEQISKIIAVVVRVSVSKPFEKVTPAVNLIYS